VEVNLGGVVIKTIILELEVPETEGEVDKVSDFKVEKPLPKQPVREIWEKNNG